MTKPSVEFFKAEEVMQIQLKSGGYALVDAEDYPLLSRFSWHEQKGHKTSYAMTGMYIGSKKVSIGMHRLVLGVPLRYVDHINRNGLDNRKENLRITTMGVNVANSKRTSASATGYRGVTLSNSSRRSTRWRKRYAARIRKDNVRITIGTYDTAEEAARAYDLKAIELWGPLVELNFPEESRKRAKKLLEGKP